MSIPGGDKETYAFLGCGSDSILIKESLLKTLELESRPVSITVIAVTGTSAIPRQSTRINVKAMDESENIYIGNALSIPRIFLGIAENSIAKEAEKQTLLCGISFKESKAKEVALLIGCDLSGRPLARRSTKRESRPAL
ncbi:hypothetical protein FGIG_11516 [Fasciola gigantica]|uniref:Uncharacterized protein n=1 Tax=Fasciola gigantica TaxID=46835 RepID=A0A504Y5D0_FASGI|nr:hypothetical protein FGIG_11516 [Fasciola gigantica]